MKFTLHNEQMAEDSDGESAELRDEIAGLRVGALEDLKMAQKNGVSLNPFSTLGGRHFWNQGWDGVRPANLTDGSGNWRFWERGRQARIIVTQQGLAATPFREIIRGESK